MNRRWSALALACAVLLGAAAPAQAQEGKAEVKALYLRGEALRKAFRWKEAAAVHEKAVAKALVAYGPTDPSTAALMNNLAGLYQEMGQDTKAELLYLRSLKIKESRLGKDHPSVATALHNLAGVYKSRGAYAKAEPLYLRSLKIDESRLGKDHPEVAASLNSLAGLYQAMGAYAKAELLYQRSLKIFEKKLGKDHPSVANALNNLAALYHSMGEHAKAEPLYQRCLEIEESRLGKDHPSVATPLGNLAALYRAMGAYAKAEPLFHRSLAIREAKLGKDHPDVASSLHNLALLYQAMGSYAKAEPLYQRSLKIDESRLGKDHPSVATDLNSLAGLYRAMGAYAKAEPVYQRSLEIYEAKLGKDHPQVANALNNLAVLYHATGADAKAEPLYQRCLEISEKKLGKDHPDVAQSLSNLAGVHQAMGEHAKAEPLYQRSLTIFEKKLGKDHPDVANALHNLAVLYQATGAHAKAEPLYRRSLEIREAKLGKDHPDVARSLNSLAVLYAATGEPGKASALVERARRGARRHLAAVLPALSDADRAAFFKSTPVRLELEVALSLGLAHGNDAELAAQSATWLLNGKGIDQESLASAVLLARQSTDPALARLAGQLLSLRQQLARLTFTTPRPGQEKQRLRQIEELTAAEQQLARTLRSSGSKAVLPSWIDLPALRDALPADAVLIDIAHVRVFDFKGKRGKAWQLARYAAWVTPKGGAVRLIDLGPADAIDGAVKAFREAIQDGRKRIKEEGEEKAERTLRTHLETLSRLVLTPLLPHIGASKKWLISPDGNLWLLPFEALTLKDGAYAVEAHRISYLTSGRDLLPGPATTVKATAPLVLADPDFDLDPGKARAESRRHPRKGQDEELPRALSGAFRLGAVTRLPGTASEAAAIAPGLERYAGAAPRVHTRAEALERVLKAARHPRVLVLCTHGFFLPDQQTPRDEQGAGRAKAVKKWESPLLRCGLLLAGCNNAAKAASGDDGVLTGLEILDADLRACELVVLSACETGVGDVRSGEGVSGLRQAFQLAGARAVVSTLWQVPDKSSARLMTLFFDNLSKGMSKAESLRAAKLKLIEERREDYAAAHPFFWAAFTLTGAP
jgi:CHAT domain-containing protein/Tfp pilus assembly protein PilF